MPDIKLTDIKSSAQIDNMTDNQVVSLFAQVKAATPNLDPKFFIPSIGANISAESVSKEPYRFHPWIYRSVSVITNNLAPLEKILVDKNDDTIYEDTDPYGIIKLLNNPNSMMTGVAFWQAILMGLLLPDGEAMGKDVQGGSVFLVADSETGIDGGRVNLRKGEIPRAFYPYYERSMKPIIEDRGGLGQLKGWKLKVKDGKDRHFRLENLIRINLFNPYNWLRGIPVFSAAQLALSQDTRANVYNAKFFDNNAVPAGLLKAKQMMTPEQMRTMLKMFIENYSGAGNVGKTAGIPYDVEFEHIGTTHNDMQWKEQKLFNKDEIIAVFGLNKIAMGDYEQINMATIRTGRKMLWTDTYMPLNDIVWTAINEQWIQYVDSNRGLSGTSDYSNVRALQEDHTEATKTAGNMVQRMKYPATLASRLNNIPLTDEDVEKYPWLDEQPTSGPTITVPEEEEDQKAVIKSFSKKIVVGSDEWYALSRDYISKVLTPGEKQFTILARRFFNAQRNRVLDNIDTWRKTQEAKSVLLVKAIRVRPEELLFDTTEDAGKMQKLFTPAYKAQIKREARRLDSELDGLIEWNASDEKMESFIKKRKQDIKNINTRNFNEARDKIGALTETAINENWTPIQLAGELKTYISDFYETKKDSGSLRIARTETGIISSDARYDAFKTEGIEYHQWLNSADELVRENHADGTGDGGQVVRVGERFPVTGLLHPLDPSGPPEEIINCRCVAIAVQSMEG